MVHTTKNYPTADCSSFHVLGRVMSGTLESNSDVRILGESYSIQDEEDCRKVTVGRLWVYCARFELTCIHDFLLIDIKLKFLKFLLAAGF